MQVAALNIMKTMLNHQLQLRCLVFIPLFSVFAQCNQIKPLKRSTTPSTTQKQEKVLDREIRELLTNVEQLAHKETHENVDKTIFKNVNRTVHDNISDSSFRRNSRSLDLFFHRSRLNRHYPLTRHSKRWHRDYRRKKLFYDDERKPRKHYMRHHKLRHNRRKLYLINRKNLYFGDKNYHHEGKRYKHFLHNQVRSSKYNSRRRQRILERIRDEDRHWHISHKNDRRKEFNEEVSLTSPRYWHKMHNAFHKRRPFLRNEYFQKHKNHRSSNVGRSLRIDDDDDLPEKIYRHNSRSRDKFQREKTNNNFMSRRIPGIREGTKHVFPEINHRHQSRTKFQREKENRTPRIGKTRKESKRIRYVYPERMNRHHNRRKFQREKKNRIPRIGKTRKENERMRYVYPERMNRHHNKRKFQREKENRITKIEKTIGKNDRMRYVYPERINRPKLYGHHFYQDKEDKFPKISRIEHKGKRERQPPEYIHRRKLSRHNPQSKTTRKISKAERVVGHKIKDAVSSKITVKGVNRIREKMTRKFHDLRREQIPQNNTKRPKGNLEDKTGMNVPKQMEFRCKEYKKQWQKMVTKINQSLRKASILAKIIGEKFGIDKKTIDMILKKEGKMSSNFKDLLKSF